MNTPGGTEALGDVLGRLTSVDHRTVVQVSEDISLVLTVIKPKLSDQGHHEFFYEILPIFKIAKHLNAQSVRYFPRQHPYDGELLLATGELPKIECTRAMSATDRFIAIELKRRDRDPGYDKPIGFSSDRSEFFRQLICLLVRAFVRKNRRNNHPSNSLVISYENIHDSVDGMLEGLLGSIIEFWKIVSRRSRFSAVFVIGDFGEVIWCSTRD